MPGKDKDASKKEKKPKKKTKKQLKQEAEDLAIFNEAKAAADKEAEQKAEEDRLQAIEDARIAEENAVARAEELSRLALQHRHDRKFKKFRKAAIKDLDAKVAQEDEWRYYTECVPLPTVTKEADLQTYKTMFKDESSGSLPPHSAMTRIVNACETTEQVIKLLGTCVSQAWECWDHDRLNWYANYTRLLRNISHEKLDQVTSRFIQSSDEYEKGEEKVALMCYGKPHVKYGLWIHTIPEVRVRQINLEAMGIHVALPSTLFKKRTAIRVVYTAYDHLKHLVPDVVRARQREEAKARSLYPWPEDKRREEQTTTYGDDPKVMYRSVGGVINLEQLHLPPPGKIAKDCLMREITEVSDTVTVHPYPGKLQEGEVALPFRVTYTIPSHVLLGDEKPKYGWWDDANGEWSTEDIFAAEFSPETRVVEVQISKTKPFSVIQPRALDFPYREWGLRPLSNNTVLLTLQGSRYDVSFEITGGAITLKSPELPALVESNLFNVPMKPGLLLLGLAECGLNLLPTDDDAVAARKPLKTGELEMFMHEQVAKNCLLFEYQGNRLNSSLPTDQTLVNIRLGQELAERTVTEDQGLEDLVDEDDIAERKAREEAERKAKEEAEAEELRLQEEAKAKEDDIMASLYADMNADKNEEQEEEEVDDDNAQEPEEKDTVVVPNTTSLEDWAPVLSSTEKFYVVETGIRGITSKPDVCLEGRMSHVSVQRVMVEHYSPFDKTNEHSSIPEGDRLKFNLNRALNRLDRKEDTLHLLETVRKTLNLVRPFTFH